MTTSLLASVSSKDDNNNNNMDGRPCRRRRIWVDTDVAFDDIVALECLLAHHKHIDLITTVSGASTASAGAQALQKLYTAVKRKKQNNNNNNGNLNDTTIISAPDRAISRMEEWMKPFPLRLATFCDHYTTATAGAVVETPVSNPSSSITGKEDNISININVPFMDQIRSFLSSSSSHDDTQDIDLFCLGPLTNLAVWMDDPTICALLKKHVHSIWILGGSLPENSKDEESFNFFQDPIAASYVFDHASQCLPQTQFFLLPGEEAAYKKVDDKYIPFILSVAKDTSLNHSLLANVIREEQNFAIFYDPLLIFVYYYLYNYQDKQQINDAAAAQFSKARIKVCSNTGKVRFPVPVDDTATRKSIDVAATPTTTMPREDHIQTATTCTMISQIDFRMYRPWLLDAMELSNK